MSKKNFSGAIVKLVKVDEEDYVSLNKIVQSGNFSEPSERIKRWLRSNATIKYLAILQKKPATPRQLVQKINQYVSSSLLHRAEQAKSQKRQGDYTPCRF